MKNTRTFLIFRFFAILSILIFVNSCKKEENKQMPVLSTSGISKISETAAKSGGNITSSGGAAITARGVCWSIATTPTITDNKTIDGSREGTFVSYLSGLSAGKTYNIRAYAANSVGTGYGNTLSFSTPVPSKPALPIITTSHISSISPIAARSGGIITSDGGAPILARGVCWSIDTIPVIWDNRTTDGAGNGSFLSDLSGLTAGTTYYLRAYAINSVGTSYGDIYSFTTKIADIDGNTYTIVTIGTQVWMAENLKTTKFKSGDDIPEITYNDRGFPIKTSAYCNYNNLPGYKDSYGLYYNFYAVTDSKKLCPTGWHIPTDNEWTTLIKYLGGKEFAGEKLKETGTAYWSSPNLATNSSGFSARGGGHLSGNNIGIGSFEGMGYYGIFWSSTVFDDEEYGLTHAIEHAIASSNTDIGTTADYKQCGNSVRCMKN